ncbi:hypothetical protein NBRC3188_0723 [Acetobacter pasteurianus NBRC 3188]|uniref:Uncharacterized protein n=1 Tax=Acetobacter pasteurianus NBRC 3188 TaxID=1226663 RepID=A0A401WRU7_ACEPA|nr:hypothetical protein NBRC3188_0723 [Acetobacter pasteurianus NBRC 3188]
MAEKSILIHDKECKPPSELLHKPYHQLKNSRTGAVEPAEWLSGNWAFFGGPILSSAAAAEMRWRYEGALPWLAV